METQPNFTGFNTTDSTNFDNARISYSPQEFKADLPSLVVLRNSYAEMVNPDVPSGLELENLELFDELIKKQLEKLVNNG